MGDTKHIRLTVPHACREKIQEAIHSFPGVHTHNYPKGPDRNSLTVEVHGNVDVGKLYDRLKKITCSVEIESVIPGDVHAKMERLEEDLKSEIETARKTNQRFQSKIKSLDKDKKNLQRNIEDHESKIESLNKDKKNLQRKIEGHEEDKKNLHRKIEGHESKLESLKEDKKNLQRKIKDLENNNERWTSVTSAERQARVNSIIKGDREHKIKQDEETIAHLKSNISKLEEIYRMAEDGCRAKEGELEQLKQQLRQLLTPRS